MIDALSPTIIRETEGEDGDDSLFIVMPMRL
jgi:DNA polymerase III sliding clamp (beta) subunit (PCNA family)